MFSLVLEVLEARRGSKRDLSPVASWIIYKYRISIYVRMSSRPVEANKKYIASLTPHRFAQVETFEKHKYRSKAFQPPSRTWCVSGCVSGVRVEEQGRRNRRKGVHIATCGVRATAFPFHLRGIVLGSESRSLRISPPHMAKLLFVAAYAWHVLPSLGQTRISTKITAQKCSGSQNNWGRA